MLHCFSSLRLLAPALERGWFVSFAGNVTYPKAGELRTAAARVPAAGSWPRRTAPTSLLSRSEAAGTSRRIVVHTLATLAEARGEDRDELESAIDANATAAFGLP